MLLVLRVLFVSFIFLVLKPNFPFQSNQPFIAAYNCFTTRNRPNIGNRIGHVGRTISTSIWEQFSNSFDVVDSVALAGYAFDSYNDPVNNFLHAIVSYQYSM